MTFTIENLEYFLFIFVRITGFVYVAPFFSLKNVPGRVKIGLSGFTAIILFSILPYESVQYATTIDYASIIIREALCGVILGFFANIAFSIINFAGYMMDMEIGFSMASQFDPISNVQATITSNLYTYSVMLVMLVSNLHHYILKAFIDSYTVVPLGKVVIKPQMYSLVVEFIANYFVIGFRIILPMFAAILIVNIVLGILAKVAPQMNMFVVGLQLKVLVGLVVLWLMAGLIPGVADFIFNNIMDMLKSGIRAFGG